MRLVLISTYWNVNAVAITTAIVALSFNLNLLECKYSLEQIQQAFENGFNLNLLECKFLRLLRK